jgi:Icc-related predicted phosphoesterase
MKITVTSDTHGLHDSVIVPPGDIFVHAGDMTPRGSIEDMIAFNDWLGTLDYKHKIVIAGNHDFCFENDLDESRNALSNAILLHDEEIVIDGVKFYGSPWQPEFLDWAFNLPRGEPLREKWRLIPDDTDVLITHGPALGHGDKTVRGEPVGCEDLLDRIKVLQPKIHVFGHIHEGFGTTIEGATQCVNASFADSNYKPANQPFEVQI